MRGGECLPLSITQPGCIDPQPVDERATCVRAEREDAPGELNRRVLVLDHLAEVGKLSLVMVGPGDSFEDVHQHDQPLVADLAEKQRHSARRKIPDRRESGVGKGQDGIASRSMIRVM